MANMVIDKVSKEQQPITIGPNILTVDCILTDNEGMILYRIGNSSPLCFYTTYKNFNTHIDFVNFQIEKALNDVLHLINSRLQKAIWNDLDVENVNYPLKLRTKVSISIAQDFKTVIHNPVFLIKSVIDKASIIFDIENVLFEIVKPNVMKNVSSYFKKTRTS